jgi:hypothetical protein
MIVQFLFIEVVFMISLQKKLVNSRKQPEQSKTKDDIHLPSGSLSLKGSGKRLSLRMFFVSSSISSVINTWLPVLSIFLWNEGFGKK